MKMNPKMARSGFTLVELLVVMAIIATLAGVGVPALIKQQKKGHLSEAVQNVKQIGIYLSEFEQEYGSYPDANTAKQVAENTDTPISSGNSANDRFRQIINAGMAKSESVFYCKTSYTNKPDNIYEPSDKALVKGEVGYGMIVKADGSGLTNSGNQSRPVVCAPFTSEMNNNFDYDVYGGKGVIYKMDNSAATPTIIEKTKALKINGKSLIQSGADTVWGADMTVKFAHPIPRSGATSSGGGSTGGGGGNSKPAIDDENGGL